jgi:hypothetical protein
MVHRVADLVDQGTSSIDALADELRRFVDFMMTNNHAIFETH